MELEETSRESLRSKAVSGESLQVRLRTIIQKSPKKQLRILTVGEYSHTT